jgi:NAD(P)-dependent dehydrogenase (short-subunit alcohol dehydrogenase family)
MDLKLAGKVGIITGASRGIGRAIAQALSEEGMHLALTARSTDQLQFLAESLPAPALVHTADLREPEAAGRLVSATLQRFGKLDLVVNNAGATRRGDFLTLTDADWQDGFGLKFFGAMRCSRAAWPHLKSTNGSVINIVGVGGRTGSAEFAIGGAVNAALLNLTKVLADRGMRDGVRVNAINPGSIKTERLELRIKKVAAEKKLEPGAAAQMLANSLQVARFGEPEEIAAAVAFLVSPGASYIQGAILDIDGGQTRTL